MSVIKKSKKSRTEFFWVINPSVSYRIHNVIHNVTVGRKDIIIIPISWYCYLISKCYARRMRPYKVESCHVPLILSNSNYRTFSPLDSSWWGTKRIDYMVQSPEGLQQFPTSTLIQLCYNSYWESKDIVTFIVWQVSTSAHAQKTFCDWDCWLRTSTLTFLIISVATRCFVVVTTL